MTKNKEKQIELYLMEYQLKCSNIPIKDLEIRFEAFRRYVESREMCEAMC